MIADRPHAALRRDDYIPSVPEQDRWFPLPLERRRLTQAGALTCEQAEAKADGLMNDFIASSDGPAILRLKMLEMKIKVAGPLPDDARRSAQDLIGALRRAIAEKPAISFADVVAKLKTCDELAGDTIGEKADRRQMRMIQSAIAARRRLRASV